MVFQNLHLINCANCILICECGEWNPEQKECNFVQFTGLNFKKHFTPPSIETSDERGILL